MTELENRLVCEALSHYALGSANIHFIRHNENLSCRVSTNEGDYALRIRRPVEGFEISIFESLYTNEQLMRGETELLLHLSEGTSFPVQRPAPTREGQPMCVLSDGSPACLLSWLEGETVKAADEGLSYELGRLAAAIHSAAEGFTGVRMEYAHPLIAAMRRGTYRRGARRCMSKCA